MIIQPKNSKGSNNISLTKVHGLSLSVDTSIKGSNTKTRESQKDVFVGFQKEKNTETSLQNGGTPFNLNKEFTSIYDDLHLYALKASIKINRSIPVEDILSECFLYVYSRRDRITDKSQLTAWCKKWIKSHLYWGNGSLVRQSLDIKAQEIPQNLSLTIDYSVTEQMILDWIKEWEMTLSAMDKRIWNMWHHQNIRKGKEFAKFLNISVDYGFSLVRDGKRLDLSLRNYIKQKELL